MSESVVKFLHSKRKSVLIFFGLNKRGVNLLKLIERYEEEKLRANNSSRCKFFWEASILVRGR